MENHEVEDSEVVQPLRTLARVATESDLRVLDINQKREAEALGICRQKILEHGLVMKLVDVEYAFNGAKIMFYFTADGRVDFRELVKDLAGVFRTRIELRQIGVRDEAKMLGGIGICGRPFCCAQFLDDFIPVSIKMAKTQNLSLNPTKISGCCGRLMCCLKYEQDAYEDAVRRCPKQDSFVQTPDGIGNVSNVDLLREQVVVRLDEHPESPKRYRNSEIRVLRNGKGSRDGIEIPDDLPERFVKPEEENIPLLSDLLSAAEQTAAEPEADESAPAEAAGEKRSRSHRGGRSHRRGGRGRGGAAAEKPTAEAGTAVHTKEKAPQKLVAHAVVPGDKPAAEKHADGEKTGGTRRRRPRGGRNHRRGGGSAAPKAEN